MVIRNVFRSLIVSVLFTTILLHSVFGQTSTTKISEEVSLTAYLPYTIPPKTGSLNAVLELHNSTLPELRTSNLPAMMKAHEPLSAQPPTASVSRDTKEPLDVIVRAIVVYPTEVHIHPVALSRRVNVREVICPTDSSILFKVELPHEYFEPGCSCVVFLLETKRASGGLVELCRSQLMYLAPMDAERGSH